MRRALTLSLYRRRGRGGEEYDRPRAGSSASRLGIMFFETVTGTAVRPAPPRLAPPRPSYRIRAPGTPVRMIHIGSRSDRSACRFVWGGEVN